VQNPVNWMSMSTLYCFGQADRHINYNKLDQSFYIPMC
jgi:hypothetical protein